MYLFCPSCSTSFSIDGISIGMQGRSVRCFKCGHTWRQFPSVPKELEIKPVLLQNPVQPYAQLLSETQPQQMAPVPQPQQMAPEDKQIEQELPSDQEIEEMVGGDEPEIIGSLSKEVENHETSLEELEAFDEPEPLKVLFDEAPSDDEQNIDPEDIPDPEPTNRIIYEDTEEKPKSSLLKKITIISLVLFLLIGVFVSAILMRHTLVNITPSFNAVFSMVGFRVDIPGDGLKIVSKKPSREKRDGKDVTIINGRIVNVSSGERKVPEIVISAIDGSGKTVKTQIVKPSKLILRPGKAVNFKASIVSMPKSAKRLDITYGSFITAKDNKK